MNNADRFLKYIEQFNIMSVMDLYEHSYRFNIPMLTAIFLIHEVGWVYDLGKDAYINPDKKDPNSLIENTDFKPKEYNTKSIRYRRK